MCAVYFLSCFVYPYMQAVYSTVPKRLWVKFHVSLTTLKFCGATLFIKLYQEPVGSWLYMVV